MSAAPDRPLDDSFSRGLWEGSRGEPLCEKKKKKKGVCELLAGAPREATDYEIRLSMQPCAFGPHRCLRPWRCLKHDFSQKELLLESDWPSDKHAAVIAELRARDYSDHLALNRHVL